MSEEKKIAFTMIVDDDRCEMLQVMCSSLMMDFFQFAQAHPDRAERVAKSMKSFIQEFSGKEHDMGWCRDENCKHGKHE